METYMILEYIAVGLFMALQLFLGVYSVLFVVGNILHYDNRKKDVFKS